MSKQLYFFHTEEDIIQFLSYLEKCYGKIVVNSILYSPSKIVNSIVSEMAILCSQYTVAHVPSDSFIKQSRTACIGDGTAIEFHNCRRWTDNSHTYLDIGRIYLCTTKQGIYDEHALTLYKKLHRYFKREYNYNKVLGAYLSKVVQEQYNSQNLRFSQMGHPISYRTD